MKKGDPASTASLHSGHNKGKEGRESRTRGKGSGLVRQGDVTATAAAVSLQLQPPITGSHMHSFLYLEDALLKLRNRPVPSLEVDVHLCICL